MTTTSVLARLSSNSRINGSPGTFAVSLNDNGLLQKRVYGISVESITVPNVRPNLWKVSTLFWAENGFSSVPISHYSINFPITVNVVVGDETRTAAWTHVTPVTTITPQAWLDYLFADIRTEVLAQTGVTWNFTSVIEGDENITMVGTPVLNITTADLVHTLKIVTSEPLFDLYGVDTFTPTNTWTTTHPPVSPYIALPIGQYDINQLVAEMNTLFASSGSNVVVSISSAIDQRLLFTDVIGVTNVYPNTFAPLLTRASGLAEPLLVASLGTPATYLTALQGDVVVYVMSNLVSSKYTIDTSKTSVQQIAVAPLGTFGTYMTTQPQSSPQMHSIEYLNNPMFNNITVQLQDIDGVPIDIGTSQVDMVIRFWYIETGSR